MGLSFKPIATVYFLPPYRGPSTGVKFEEGTCRILSSEQRPLWDDLPTCSCGKNCNEEYPCLTVQAYFVQDGAVEYTGTIHENYYALNAECLHVPHCNSNFQVNADNVYNYFQKNIVPLVDYDTRYPFLQGYNTTKVFYSTNFTFSCWGYDGDIYIDHSYSMQNVYLSLLIPSGAILLGLFITGTMGSNEHRSCVADIMFLPLIFVAGIIEAMEDCFDCGRPKCDCFKRTTRDSGNNGSTMNIDRSYMGSERIRRSLSANTFGSIDLGSLDLRPRISNVDEPSHSSVLPPYGGSSGDTGFPSSTAPPSYNNLHNMYNGYDASCYPSSPIVTGPTDSSLYNTDSMPPPPSYDDVVDS
ncbi:hypothetical protein ACHWQZ_G007137 [Mnemiopsis leidyi]